MPAEFEVVANNCELVKQILDAGIDAYAAARVGEPALQFTCMETSEPALGALQICLAIYFTLVIPTLIAWAILYRRGEPAESLCMLGGLSMIFPLVAPIIMLSNFGHSANAGGRVLLASHGLIAKRRPNADDQP